MATFIETMLNAAAGSIATVRPDYIVVTDGPSHKAVEMVRSVACPEKVMVIFDHDVPTGSPQAADILRKINRFAREFGCNYIQAEGVGYQWMLNENVKPGQIVIGGGRHNSIYGANGALGLNVSATELARVIESGYYSFIVPETVTVALTGKLDGSAIDAGLALRRLLGAAAKGKAVELTAEGLSEQEKAVICGMACGSGAFTAVFTQAQAADLTLDLGSVVPMIQMPCGSREEQQDAAIVPKKAVEGVELQAGQIGGFTGGTIADLRKAAALMEGKTLKRGFRLSIVPATSKDYLEAMNEGLIEKFIDFNAQINAVGDKSVVWQGAGVIDKGEKLLTTGLYTYDGCMGVPGSLVYTGSVESVISAAVTKTI